MGYSGRIKQFMLSAGIDGVIVNSPENFFYLTGFSSHQHSVSRQPHFATVVMDSCPNSCPIAVGMDFEIEYFNEHEHFDGESRPFSTWVGAKKLEDIKGNTECLAKTAKKFLSPLDVIGQAVNDLAIANAVIGLELDYVPFGYYEQLKKKFPNAKFVNVSPLFIEARSVKQTGEIAFFRRLTEVADEALNFTFGFVREGISERELFDIYCEKVIESHCCFPSGWSSFTGGENAGRLGRSGTRKLKSRDILKFDGGVNGDTSFYTTDFSRTLFVGEPDPVLLLIKERLLGGLKLMLETAKPGIRFGKLFDIGYGYVKEKLPFYERGHLGHNISLGPQTAEPPYISPGCEAELEEGMVLCFEVPFYITGYGGFNLEDMVLITRDGCECLTYRTPH